MTESEFKQIRSLKNQFHAMLIRDNLTKRYHVILDDLQKLIDTYLYNDYKKALSEMILSNDTESKYKYMLSFISKYEKQYGENTMFNGNLT